MMMPACDTAAEMTARDTSIAVAMLLMTQDGQIAGAVPG
jgi:hypothetical protein